MLPRHGWRHVESILHLCTHARTVGLTEYVDSTGRGSTFVVLEMTTWSLAAEWNSSRSELEVKRAFPLTFFTGSVLLFRVTQFATHGGMPRQTENVESCVSNCLFRRACTRGSLKRTFSARGCVLPITRRGRKRGG